MHGISAVMQVVEGTDLSNHTAAVIPFLSFRGVRLEWYETLRALPAAWVCWMYADPIHGGLGCLCHHDTWTEVARLTALVAGFQDSVTGLVWSTECTNASESHWMFEHHYFLLMLVFLYNSTHLKASAQFSCVCKPPHWCGAICHLPHLVYWRCMTKKWW